MVVHDDGEVVADGCFSVIQNSNPYTYVGHRPFNLSPDVTLDGPLTAMTLTELRSGPFIKLMFATLRSRDAMLRSPIVSYHPGVRWLEIAMDDPVPFQVDGDAMGDAERKRDRLLDQLARQAQAHMEERRATRLH